MSIIILIMLYIVQLSQLELNHLHYLFSTTLMYTCPLPLFLRHNHMKSFTDLGCTYYDTLSLHAANWAVSNLSLVTYSSKKWNAPVLSKESTLFNFQSFFEGHMSQNRGRKNNYYRSSSQLAAWSQSSGGGLGRLYLQNGGQLQRIHYDSSTPQRYFFWSERYYTL